MNGERYTVGTPVVSVKSDSIKAKLMRLRYRPLVATQDRWISSVGVLTNKLTIAPVAVRLETVG